VFAADDMPIAALSVPVAVLVRVPVGVIPIGIGVDSRAIVGMNCRAIIRMDSSPVGLAGMISAIGGMNGRATSGVDCRAITSLNCCAITIMSCFTVFPFIGIRVKTGG
jgi:hypothetical protein